MPRKKIEKIKNVPAELPMPEGIYYPWIKTGEFTGFMGAGTGKYYNYIPDYMSNPYKKNASLVNASIDAFNKEIENHNADIDKGTVSEHSYNFPLIGSLPHQDVKEAWGWFDNAKAEMKARYDEMQVNNDIYNRELLKKISLQNLQLKNEIQDVRGLVAKNKEDINNLVNRENKNDIDYFSSQLILMHDEDTKTIAAINEQLMNTTQENIALQKSLEDQKVENDKKLDAYNKRVDKLQGLYDASIGELRFAKSELNDVTFDLKGVHQTLNIIEKDAYNVDKSLSSLQQKNKELQELQTIQNALLAELNKGNIETAQALRAEAENNEKKINALQNVVKFHQQHNKSQFDLLEKSFNNTNDSIDILGKKVEGVRKTGAELGAKFWLLKDNLAATKKETDEAKRIAEQKGKVIVKTAAFLNKKIVKQAEEANVNFKELFSRNEYIRRAVVDQGKKMRTTLGKETQKAFKDRAYALQFVRRGRNALLLEEI